MLRSLFLGLVIATTAAWAAETPPALASLTYSGDQSALDALDREIIEAGRDPAKLAAIEARLVAVLRHKDSTYAARQAVCQRLGAILSPSNSGATKHLGTMLLDPREAELARLALVPVPGAEIDALFLTALGKTSGPTRVGIIESVARRRIEGAVAALTSLLSDADATTAAAAARALGKIASPSAAAALRTAKGPNAVTLAHARLETTQRLPAADAQSVLRELENDTALPAHVRAAAFRRSLDLDTASAVARITQVLGTSDWTLKQAALEALAGALPPAAVGSLAGKISAWDAPTQTAVIAALARSGEAATVPAIVAATRHSDAGVRTEAFTALGFLPGSAETVTLLAQTAAGDSADAKVARQSLARLNGPGVSAAVLAGADRADAKLRPVYLELLALRSMTEALPLLLKCRTEADAGIRAAAVGALGDLAPASEQKTILDWAAAATDDAEQTKALRALVNVTLRNPSVAERGRPIYAAIEAAKPEVALRLVPVLGRIGGTASADCAARLASGPELKLAQAAVDILGRWTDATALPALATVTEKSKTPAIRDSACATAVRYVERNREPWTPETTAIVARLVTATQQAGSRKQLIALLARANDNAALKLAESLKSDSALGADAAYAAAAIKAALAGTPKSRTNPASGANNILDGKTSSRWSAPALGEEWVEIDFRLSRPLRRLTLDQTARATEFPERFEVHVTDDPKSPGAVVAQGQGQRNKTVIDLPAGTAGRYVIIKNTAERKDTPWTICELYVD